MGARRGIAAAVLGLVALAGPQTVRAEPRYLMIDVGAGSGASAHFNAGGLDVRAFGWNGSGGSAEGTVDTPPSVGDLPTPVPAVATSFACVQLFNSTSKRWDEGCGLAKVTIDPLLQTATVVGSFRSRRGTINFNWSVAAPATNVVTPQPDLPGTDFCRLPSYCVAFVNAALARAGTATGSVGSTWAGSITRRTGPGSTHAGAGGVVMTASWDGEGPGDDGVEADVSTYDSRVVTAKLGSGTKYSTITAHSDSFSVASSYGDVFTDDFTWVCVTFVSGRTTKRGCESGTVSVDDLLRTARVQATIKIADRVPSTVTVDVTMTANDPAPTVVPQAPDPCALPEACAGSATQWSRTAAATGRVTSSSLGTVTSSNVGRLLRLTETYWQLEHP